ncbi:hypothetical protein AVEN_116669-1 [Araneus ventricosus]|uniref:RNase H type-1 domain-containing protein n=1 Tax=Araneus ventricosus TaxID=182803 RepID=A0A4Y2WZ89_ARAVE|nr:hypothetical protein AVEN_116669-1 [Araneus ventricosus]
MQCCSPERKTEYDTKAFPPVNFGTYRTTPTASLQTILGIPLLHLQLLYEAQLTSLYRLRKPLPPNVTGIKPEHLEMKETGWQLHLSKHLQQNQITIEVEELDREEDIKVFTDGSKTEGGVDAAFCTAPKRNYTWTSQWSAKLNHNSQSFKQN